MSAEIFEKKASNFSYPKTKRCLKWNYFFLQLACAISKVFEMEEIRLYFIYSCT